jgi:hypothetical protein
MEAGRGQREYHAWIVGEQETNDLTIDLASRHYRGYADRGDIPWTIPDFPPSLWYNSESVPDGLYLIPHHATTTALERSMFGDEKDLITGLTRQALGNAHFIIRLRAYQRWAERGRPLWDALTDWLEARRDFGISDEIQF